jgi:hypothetical protein
MMFDVWQKWLVLSCAVIVVFGLLLALFNQSPVFDLLFNNQINPVFWRGRIAPHDVQLFQRWSYGILGCTVAGWGILMGFVAAIPFNNKEKWAWTAIAVSMAVWFISDTLLSLASGVTFNAMFNLIFFLAIGIPLVFTYREFFDHTGPERQAQ